MTRSGSRGSTSSLASDDDAFFKQWAANRQKALAETMDPLKVVVQFLANTKIPYAIIGGKAAAFHLVGTTASDAQKALAVATNDYDVIVTHEHSRLFMEMLQTALRNHSRITLDEKVYESDAVKIVLMGVKKNGFFDSIVDVHVLNSLNADHFPKSVIKDPVTKLVYADKSWICKELKFSLKYHVAADEITKTLKRQARMSLLNC